MTEQALAARPRLAAELLALVPLAFSDPGAAWARVRRLLGVLRARWLFRGCERGELVNALCRVRVEARGRVRLGARVQFWEGMIPQEVVCAPGAELIIGASSMFNYGVSLRAERSVRIGERCMFGSLVIVHDHDGELTAPIVIEDDVWVAYGAVVAPGVTIGRGSVIGAGSVVTADVPPRSLAVGNPARCSPLPASRTFPPEA
ncbi:MAG TPA: acyltransferase [Myxococcales bacterium]|nr:acyltransferase [Myxococcales bacterium]